MSSLITNNLDELLNPLRDSPESFTSEQKLAAAVKQFESERISSCRAAELAGIPRVEFLRLFAEFEVPVIDLTRQKLEQDLENAQSFINNQV